jgi:hypothetical protein
MKLKQKAAATAKTGTRFFFTASCMKDSLRQKGNRCLSDDATAYNFAIYFSNNTISPALLLDSNDTYATVVVESGE